MRDVYPERFPGLDDGHWTGYIVRTEAELAALRAENAALVRDKERLEAEVINCHETVNTLCATLVNYGAVPDAAMREET